MFNNVITSEMTKTLVQKLYHELGQKFEASLDSYETGLEVLQLDGIKTTLLWVPKEKRFYVTTYNASGNRSVYLETWCQATNVFVSKVEKELETLQAKSKLNSSIIPSQLKKIISQELIPIYPGKFKLEHHRGSGLDPIEIISIKADQRRLAEIKLHNKLIHLSNDQTLKLNKAGVEKLIDYCISERNNTHNNKTQKINLDILVRLAKGEIRI